MSGEKHQCAYCSHAATLEELKAHIFACDRHPMAALKLENERLKAEVRALKNNSPTFKELAASE